MQSNTAIAVEGQQVSYAKYGLQVASAFVKQLKTDYLQKGMAIQDEHIARLSPDIWILSIYRVKTIYLEKAEAYGIVVLQPTELQMGSNCNYLRYFFSEEFRVSPIYLKLIAHVVNQFAKEQQSENNFRLFVAPLKQKGLLENQEMAKTFVMTAIRFDLSLALQKCIVGSPAWEDVRVSAQFYEKSMKLSTSFPAQEHQQMMAMILDGIFGETIPLRAQLRQTAQNRVISPLLLSQNHLSYQFLTVVPSMGKLMFVRIQPRRVVVSLKKGQPIAFATFQYLEFAYKLKLDVFKLKRTLPYKKIKEAIDFVVNLDKDRYKENPNALACFLPERVFPDVPKLEMRRHAFQTLQNMVGSQRGCPGIYPRVFWPDKIIDSVTASQMVRHAGEWISPIELSQEINGLRAEMILYEKENIKERVAEEEGTQQLLRFIKAIPKLKFKLTPEQDLMISTAENLLCLGRSGTGKTTSSALRLFASDAFFKFREQLLCFKVSNPQKRNKDFVVDSAFMDSQSNLKLLFVSASPVLVNEVKRFYIDLKVHLRDQLISRRQKQASAAEESKRMQAEPERDLSEQELMEKFVAAELAQLESDEHIERQTEMFARISQLSPKDYPLFLTVKRLIDMMDASTRFPFFARKPDGSQLGLSGNLEWSNEQGGVFMINHYYKQHQDFDKLVQVLGQKVLDFSSAMEVSDQVSDAELSQAQTAELHEAQDAKQRSHMGRETRTETEMELTSQNLSFEVDFDVFSMRFWPKVAQQAKVAPLVAWTEICSEIKGRVNSFEYQEGGIPLELYEMKNERKKQQSSSFLTNVEKASIYWIFLKYEQWKQVFRAYDQNDVVNHILRQVKLQKADPIPKMDFLMVDEVQDLTQNLISLLMTMTNKNIFFTGDTAQTIAKGVGFRFYDLKAIFEKSQCLAELHTQFQPPKVLQLTKNFRSHCRILDCANSVVALLELLFPKTIDKLLKETSDIDGPKPIVLDQATKGASLESFLKNYVIWGGDYGENQGSSQHQFGCDRVVIVRDQTSKQRVPEFLKNVLCLTVYEAKGLEFDEVILFNFFADTKCASQWKLLNEVLVTQTVRPKKTATDFLDFEMLDCEEASAASMEESQRSGAEEVKGEIDPGTTRIEANVEVTTVLKLKTEFAEVYRKFSQVCTELKLLYVAVTRPKKLLLIYDDDASLRAPLQKHWVRVGVVNVVTSAMLADPVSVDAAVAKALRIGEQVGLQALDRTTVEMQWRVQGFKLFKAKLFMAAKQCFENSHDEDLVTRCKAYEAAELAIGLRGQSEAKVAFYKDKSNYLKAHERNSYRQQARELLAESKSLMRQAGSFFKEIGLDKHAAQCFYSGDDNQSAVELFVKLGQSGQAAESYLQLGKLKEAAELFVSADLFANAFECFERLEDWEGLIQCLYRNKHKLGERERATYIERYFPIALNSVYQLYSALDPQGAAQIGMSEDNKGKVMQMRLRLKFQKSVSVIKEEVSDAEDETVTSDDEQEITVTNTALEASADEEPFAVEAVEVKTLEVEESKQEQRSLVIIDTGRPDELREESEDSFQVLSESDEELKVETSAANLEAETLLLPVEEVKTGCEDFELLSVIDPEDEFLKNEHSFSLIEQLSSNSHASFDVLSAHSSDFSILTGSKMHQLLQSVRSIDESIALTSTISRQVDGSVADLLNQSKYSAVTFSRDSYAEDIVLQKVIYYISLFKEDVRKALLQKRSKDLLAQVLLDIDQEARDKQEDANDIDFMMIELYEMAPETLGLILDTLEHYELYRLCLILCGKYQLNQRVGRYVSAVCHKYSNLTAKRTECLIKSRTTPEQIQKNFVLLANEAMHNVISLASQCCATDLHSVFREVCFEALLLQGFWRKLIFILDGESSLQLSMAVRDQESFKLTYLVEKLGVSDPILLQEALKSPEKFHSLVSKEIASTPWEVYAAMLKESSEVKGSIHSITCIQEKLVSANTLSKVGIVARVVATMFATVNYRQASTSKDFRFGEGLFISELQRRVTTSQLCAELSKDSLRSVFEMVETLHFIQKSLVENDGTVTRLVYEAFGIAWLEGLDLFNNLSSNYCLVDVKRLEEVCLSAAERIRDFQRGMLTVFKYKALLEVWRQKEQTNDSDFLKATLVTKQDLSDVDEYVNRAMSKLEGEKDILGHELAIACDLNLDLFLVPKLWVKEIVQSCLADFTCSFAKQILRLNISFKNNFFAVKKAIEKAIVVLSSHFSTVQSNIEDLRQQLLSKYELTPKQNEHLILLFKQYSLLGTGTPPNSYSQTIKFLKGNLQKLNQTSHGSERMNRLVFTRAPKFSIAERLASDERKEFIQLAHEKLEQAMKAVPLSSFYDLIYQAALIFVQEDFYVPLMEALSNRGRDAALTAASKTKLTKAMGLLDVHVFQKVNDYHSMATSQLAFIRAAHSDLQTKTLIKLVLQTFYQSVFSFKIHNFKATHGGVLLNFGDYVKYVDPGQTEDKKAALELARVHVKPATLSQIAEAVSWVASISQGLLSLQDNSATRTEFLTQSMLVVVTLIKNFTGEEVLRMQNSIATLVEDCLKTSNLLGKRDFAFLEQLLPIKFAKTPASLKQSIKKTKIPESMRFCRISVPEGLRKYLQSDAHKEDIQCNIYKQLEVASSVEKTVRELRSDAAAKINAFWTKKRLILQSRRLKLREKLSGVDASVTVQPLTGAKFYKLKSCYDSPEIKRAADRCPELLPTLDLVDTLARSFTFLLSSVFIKNSPDQEFVLSKLKAIQRTRLELLAFNKSSFKQTSVTMSTVNDLRSRTLALWDEANSEKAKLDAWLEHSDAQVALEEQKKARFRKMEKWNTVFAAHRASRRKHSLLSQLAKAKKH